MGVIDYIYIRVFNEYLKKKDPARFAASLYVSMTIGLVFSPILFLCAELLRTENGNADAIIFLLYFTIILVWTVCTFNKIRIQQLKTELYSKRIKLSIPSWCLFTILPIGFIWAIFMYWMILSNLIQPYNLEGSLYKLFSNCTSFQF